METEKRRGGRVWGGGERRAERDWFPELESKGSAIYPRTFLKKEGGKVN